MTEGGIASWKMKEGETFTAGDVLLEIVWRFSSRISTNFNTYHKETDKATIDVEAQDDGVIAKILVRQSLASRCIYLFRLGRRWRKKCQSGLRHCHFW